MGTTYVSLKMIDKLLVEKIWSLSNTDPAYVAEMRRVCLPVETAVATQPGPLARLPQLFCEFNGGTLGQVTPIMTAWTLLRYAARILDDIEDGSAGPLQRSDAQLLNVSTGLIFTAGMVLTFLEDFEISTMAAAEIRRRFNGELLTTCAGQHLDLALPALSVEEWWQVAGAKSGSFVGLICWAGGRAADAPTMQLDLYHQFGYTLGLLDQIRDDLADLWSSDAQRSDLHNLHNCGLPMAYALAVLPSGEQQQLLACLQKVGDSDEAEQTARELIIKSGAGVYLSVQSVRLHQEGLALITQMSLPQEAEQKLTGILDKARLPVKI